jgi:hypothetical protein
MNQFVSLYRCIVDLFLGLFMLHLQHAYTVTQKFDIILNSIRNKIN